VTCDNFNLITFAGVNAFRVQSSPKMAGMEMMT
jgi:hypothetical protein